MTEKTYQDVKIEKLGNSKVKITGEVTEAAFERARKMAVEHMKIAAEIPGFRAGKAPEAVLTNHIGEPKILERAAEDAINEAYGKIIEDENLRAIGMPRVSITKMAKGNPLGFIIETEIMPEIVLGEYKKIAADAVSKIPEASKTVEAKEIDAVIDDIRKHFGAADTAKTTGAEKTAPQVTDGKETEAKEIEPKTPALPELNDEFAKKAGFETVEALRKQAESNLLEQKQRETQEKRRAAVAEKLLDETKFDVPEIIITSELDSMIGQFKADIERSGFTFEGYLTQIKKTEDEIRKEWHDSAERRARLELILKRIGKAEKIAPSEEDVKKEVDNIVAHHKDVDRFRVRMYVENMMTNQKVFEFLEESAK